MAVAHTTAFCWHQGMQPGCKKSKNWFLDRRTYTRWRPQQVVKRCWWCWDKKTRLSQIWRKILLQEDFDWDRLNWNKIIKKCFGNRFMQRCCGYAAVLEFFLRPRYIVQKNQVECAKNELKYANLAKCERKTQWLPSQAESCLIVENWVSFLLRR